MSSVRKYTSKLEGKRLLIFGGTSGIGFAVAEASLENGAFVVISGSRPAKVEDKVQKLKSSYGSEAMVSGHACDLTNTNNLEANLIGLLDFATKDGKLDHIVFTAGDAVELVSIAEATFDAIQKGGIVRFYAAIMLAKVMPKYMYQSPDSSLTLTGGANSTKPGPNWAIMAGWGASVEGLSRGLAVDLAPTRVNCIAPGAVLTELFDRFAGERLEQVKERFKSMTKTGTMGKPEDLAESYLYCMRDKFVTGQVIHSNGGYYLA